jgi:hypothetical protein
MPKKQQEVVFADLDFSTTQLGVPKSRGSWEVLENAGSRELNFC